MLTLFFVTVCLTTTAYARLLPVDGSQSGSTIGVMLLARATENSSNRRKVGTIIGCTIAALFFAGVVLALVAIHLMKQRRKAKKRGEELAMEERRRDQMEAGKPGPSNIVETTLP